MVEILTNFNFYVYFLAVLWLSAVPLYGDENQITTSASKCDSPIIFVCLYVEYLTLSCAYDIIKYHWRGEVNVCMR